MALSPIRLMPGGLTFPTKNPALESYENAERLRFAQHADDRAQNDQSYQDELRQQQRAEDAATSDVVMKMLDEDQVADQPVVTPEPPSATRSGLAGVASGAEPPIPAMQPVAPRTSTSKLSSIDLLPGWSPGTQATDVPAQSGGLPLSPTAAAPAPLPTIDVSGRPEPQRVVEEATSAPAPAPTQSTPAPTGLSRVSSRPDNTRYDRNMAKALAKVAPGKAAQHLSNAMSKQSANFEDEAARALKILDLADAGQIDQAVALAKQYGDPVDPSVLQNGQARAVMRVSAEMAKYAGASHDESWIERFGMTYAKTKDISAAMQAAGKPAPRPAEKGIFTMNAAGDVLNTSTGAVQRGPENRNVGGRQTNEQINFEWMTRPRSQGGLGMPRDVAQRMIMEVRDNPGAKSRSIMSAATAIVNNGGADNIEDGVKQATSAYQAIEKALTPQQARTPADGEQRIFASTDGSDEPEIYSVDGGKTWWNVDDDTRYDEGE